MIFQLKQKLNLFCLRNALLSFSKLTAPDVWIKNPSSGDFQLNLLFKSHLLRFFASVSEFSWTPFSWQTQLWAWCIGWAVPKHTALPHVQLVPAQNSPYSPGTAHRGFFLPMFSLNPACISQTHEIQVSDTWNQSFPSSAGSSSIPVLPPERPLGGQGSSEHPPAIKGGGQTIAAATPPGGPTSGDLLPCASG